MLGKHQSAGIRIARAQKPRVCLAGDVTWIAVVRPAPPVEKLGGALVFLCSLESQLEGSLAQQIGVVGAATGARTAFNRDVTIQ